MALPMFVDSLLRSRPQIWSVGERLYARTPVLHRLLSLFSYDRVVRIDRARSEVVVTSKNFWFLKREETIPFSRVSHLDMEFKSIPIGGDRDPRGIQCFERFRVQLVLRRPHREIPLFTFAGGMLQAHDLPRINLQFKGFGVETGADYSHDDQAATFTEALARFIGVPVGPPVRHFATEDGAEFYCSECQRRSAPGRSDCLYCGGELEAVMSSSGSSARRG